MGFHGLQGTSCTFIHTPKNAILPGFEQETSKDVRSLHTLALAQIGSYEVITCPNPTPIPNPKTPQNVRWRVTHQARLRPRVGCQPRVRWRSLEPPPSHPRPAKTAMMCLFSTLFSSFDRT